MKKKQIMGMLLAVTMVLTLGVTGCGGKHETTTTAAGSGEQKEEPEKIVYFAQPPANYQPTDPEVLEKIRNKILEDTNVDVEFILAPIDNTEYNNKLNLMLAGGEKIDIFLTNGWEDLQRNGVLADLTTVLEENPQLQEVFGNAMEAMKTPDGKIWGLPRNGDASHYPIWIRKDWLDQLGLEMPKTIDEYETVLKAFKEHDLAGNGKTIPMLTSFENLPHCLLGAFTEGGTGVYEAPDGTVMPFFMAPGYRDMMEKVNSWYKDGLVDKETFIYKDNQRIDLVKQGRVGSAAMWFSRVTLNEQELKKLVPDANYEIAVLEGPKGKSETVNAYARLPIGISTATGTTGYVVSARSKNLEAAIKVLNWGFTDMSNYITSRYGLEGEGWKWADEEAGIFDLLIPQTGDEYCMYKGLVTEMAVRESESPNEKHVNYIYGKEIANLDRAKYPADGGIHFDMKPIYDTVPNVSDILRIYQEESIKFMTGARPLSEYDVYMDNLKKSGIDQLAVEVTKQFQAAKN